MAEKRDTHDAETSDLKDRQCELSRGPNINVPYNVSKIVNINYFYEILSRLFLLVSPVDSLNIL